MKGVEFGTEASGTGALATGRGNVSWPLPGCRGLSFWGLPMAFTCTTQLPPRPGQGPWSEGWRPGGQLGGGAGSEGETVG